MYDRIWSDYLEKRKDYPRKRTLLLGRGIRRLREEKGLSRTKLALEAKVGLPLLKAIETKEESYTAWENIERLASVLTVEPERIIERGKEEAPANLFLQRKDTRLVLEYEGISVSPCSPPISTERDFLFLKLILDPGKSLSPCLHPGSREIACYVTEGPLQFRFGGKEQEFKANQSFFFDGSVEHGFSNGNEEKRIEFFLCLNPPPGKKSPVKEKPPKRKGGLDLAFALDYVRRKASPRPGFPLPWNLLSEMTGLSMINLMYLRSGKAETVYWDKLEALAQGTGVPLEEILSVALGKTQGRLVTCTALHRGYLDYGELHGLQHGFHVYSAVRPGTARREFFIGQVFLEKRMMAIPKMRKRWRYKDNSFMCAFIQDGRVFLEYGKGRKEVLSTGDSVYFDANIEYVFHNLERQESKLFLFTHPPLF